MRAVALFLERAYPPGSVARTRIKVDELERIATVADLFARFERPCEAERGSLRRFTLRLGNARYPFMKFVVQEYLVDREFFFSVDTHDDLDVRPDNPDYAGWMDVKRFNQGLKHEIEDAWALAHLPTHADLRALAEGLACVEREAAKHSRLLVVDDETDVCRGLGTLLRARGYEVELAYDGREALTKLERGPLPDLVVLDFSMGEIDGGEVLRLIGADPRYEGLPVIVATASPTALMRIPRSTIVLRKPYAREALFALLAQMLERRPAARP